jgi:GNAT superfamily N-acetyltransferase
MTGKPIMSKPTIRPAVPADIPSLVDWNLAMARETEGRELDRDVLARGVAAVFDDPRRGFYLIGERDGVAVGGLLVTHEWSDWRNGAFFWIQSVYVTAQARRGGVFRALYADVERRARTAGAIGIRLYVEIENERAQQTYAGLGMRRCRYHMYERALSPQAGENTGSQA